MTIQTLKTFFMYLTVINGGLLVFSAIMCIFMRDFIYSFHGKMFNISRDNLNVMLYAFLGIYKIIFFALNLVPYMALVIMT